MNIYKVKHTETGEVREGSAEEISSWTGIGPNSVRLACTRGQRIKHLWSIELLGDASELPEHAKRLGLVKVCPVCGKTFTVPRIKDVTCSPACSKAYGQKQVREWYKEQTEINKSNRNPRKPKNKPMTFAQINEKARAEHLTYGQYVAKYGL